MDEKDNPIVSKENANAKKFSRIRVTLIAPTQFMYPLGLGLRLYSQRKGFEFWVSLSYKKIVLLQSVVSSASAHQPST